MTNVVPVCSSDFCNFSHMCFKSVSVCVCECLRERLNMSTRALNSGFLFCLSFLLWLLAERVGFSPSWWHCRTNFVPQPHPWSLPTHSYELCMCFNSVFGEEKKNTRLVQNFHPLPLSRARPYTLHPASAQYSFSTFHILCHPSNLCPMGLLINSWSCDGCVHRCVWMLLSHRMYSNVAALCIGGVMPLRLLPSVYQTVLILFLKKLLCTFLCCDFCIVPKMMNTTNLTGICVVFFSTSKKSSSWSHLCTL